MVCPELPPASDLFDHFCSAQTFRAILSLHKRLCLSLNVKPCQFLQFYPKLKSGLKSWKAQGLFAKFDKRASLKCYSRGLACSNTKVLVIGCGPCGLRAAIEAQLLGARVVVVEKRDRFSRNNVLHLWPMVIHDLKCLGAKLFFGKFCAGAIDHISIRQLQCILLKVALLLGVEVYESVGFRELVEPADSHSGWRARLDPEDHCVSHFQFDVLIGADGKRNTFKCFKRKEFRGKLAIAVTANFVNRCSEAEARVDEISGVAFIFNQKFFKDMFFETGIDLENIVYYKDETHYFVMTAKKQCLLKKGVIKQDHPDTVKLLSAENVSREKLMEFAREAAGFATDYQLPGLVFALNHYGREDVAMFDFTCMFASANASCVLERRGCKLLLQLVGDSLLEPFWPTGSGCARGFLSCLDAGWQLRSWANPSVSVLDCLAERESVYRLLAQTTPANISKQFNRYSLDPRTRYPNLNRRAVLASQVRGLVDTDNPAALTALLASSAVDGPLDRTPGRSRPRRRPLDPGHLRHLLRWCGEHAGLHVHDFDRSFQSGEVLCALLRHFRPGLAELEKGAGSSASPQEKNRTALSVVRAELGVSPSSALQTALTSGVAPDRAQMASFIDRIYSVLHGEIPYSRPDISELPPILSPNLSYNENHLRKRRCDQTSTSSAYEVAEKTSARSPDRDPERQQAFASKVRDIQTKMSNQDYSSSKKPKDLLRSIGKIEESDWNIKQIEDKIKQQTGSKVADHSEKRLPHWSREHFDDKVQAISDRVFGDPGSLNRQKYNAIDQELRRLENRLREGNVRDVGERGANRVSQMARKFLSNEVDSGSISTVDGTPVVPSSVTDHIQLPELLSSCHFCCGTLDEEMGSAEGLYFHSECFRCEFCETALKTGCYAFDGDSRRFFCLPHYGLHALARYKYQRNPDTIKLNSHSPTSRGRRLRAQTPERAEFENSSCLDFSSDDESLSEMDEDEWTDHNFGVSAVESAREPPVDDSDSDGGLTAGEEELSCSDDNEYVCERDNKSGRACWLHRAPLRAGSNEPSEFYESDGIEPECVESASDSEAEVQARNKRLLESRLAESMLKSRRAANGTALSDTESWTSSSESSTEDTETEVPTDPEFDPPGPRPLPTIVIVDSASRSASESSVPPRASSVEVPPSQQLPVADRKERPSQQLPVADRKERSSQQLPVADRKERPSQPLSVADRKERTSQCDHKSGSRGVPGQPALLQSQGSRTGAGRGLQKCRTDTQVNVRLGGGRANGGSETLAWKNSLALKKKYLTEQGSAGTVLASTAKTDLTSRVNSFMSRISETQKLLHPASPAGTGSVRDSLLGLAQPGSRFSWLTKSISSEDGLPCGRRLMRSATDVGFPDRFLSRQPLSRLAEFKQSAPPEPGADSSERCTREEGVSRSAPCGSDDRVLPDNQTTVAAPDDQTSSVPLKGGASDGKRTGSLDGVAASNTVRECAIEGWAAKTFVCSDAGEKIIECRDDRTCIHSSETPDICRHVDEPVSEVTENGINAGKPVTEVSGKGIYAGKPVSGVADSGSVLGGGKYVCGGAVKQQTCLSASSYSPPALDFIDSCVDADVDLMPNGEKSANTSRTYNIQVNNDDGSPADPGLIGTGPSRKNSLSLKPPSGPRVSSRRSSSCRLDGDRLLRSQSIQFPMEVVGAASSGACRRGGMVARGESGRGSCPDVRSASIRLCSARLSPATLRRSSCRGGVRDLQQNNQAIQRLMSAASLRSATSPPIKLGSNTRGSGRKPPVASPRTSVNKTGCLFPIHASNQQASALQTVSKPPTVPPSSSLGGRGMFLQAVSKPAVPPASRPPDIPPSPPASGPVGRGVFPQTAVPLSDPVSRLPAVPAASRPPVVPPSLPVSRPPVLSPLCPPASSPGMFPLRRCRTDLSCSSGQASVVRDLVLARVSLHRPIRRRHLPAPSRLYTAPPPPRCSAAPGEDAPLGVNDISPSGFSVRKPSDHNRGKSAKTNQFVPSESPSESQV